MTKLKRKKTFDRFLCHPDSSAQNFVFINALRTIAFNFPFMKFVTSRFLGHNGRMLTMHRSKTKVKEIEHEHRAIEGCYIIRHWTYVYVNMPPWMCAGAWAHSLCLPNRKINFALWTSGQRKRIDKSAMHLFSFSFCCVFFSSLSFSLSQLCWTICVRM